jgi:hypothetical protein
MLGASSENIRLEALVSVETRDGVPRALRPADVVPTRVEVSSA